MTLRPGARLRLAFVGQATFFEQCALGDERRDVLTRFVDFRLGGDPGPLRAALDEFRPHVVVVFRPETIPAGALRRPRARPRSGSSPSRSRARAAGGHPDLDRRLWELGQVDAGSFDRVVSFDPLIASTAGEVLPVWRAVPLPVADRYFKPIRRRHGRPRALVVGRSTPHREQMLSDVKASRDVLHLAFGVDAAELERQFDEHEVGVNIHNDTYLSFENRVTLHLAAGHLVLSEPLIPSHGLEVGLDYLDVSTPAHIWWAIESMTRFPGIYDRIRVRGRLKAEQFRASRVWPRLVGDLLADVDAFGTARRQPLPPVPAAASGRRRFAPASGRGGRWPRRAHASPADRDVGEHVAHEARVDDRRAEALGRAAAGEADRPEGLRRALDLAHELPQAPRRVHDEQLRARAQPVVGRQRLGDHEQPGREVLAHPVLVVGVGLVVDVQADVAVGLERAELLVGHAVGEVDEVEVALDRPEERLAVVGAAAAEQQPGPARAHRRDGREVAVGDRDRERPPDRHVALGGRHEARVVDADAVEVRGVHPREHLEARVEVGVLGAAGDVQRLGEVPDLDRVDLGQRAVGEHLRAEDEDDVGRERAQRGDERVDRRVEAEVEERGLEALHRVLERARLEVLALRDEGQAQGGVGGHAPMMTAVLRVCLLTPGTPRSGDPLLEHARRLAAAPDAEVTLALTDQRLPGGAPVTLEGARLIDADAVAEDFDVAIATGWTATAHLFSIRATRHVNLVRVLEHERMGTWQAERFAAALSYDLPVDFVATATWVRDALADLRPEARCLLVRDGLDRDVFAPAAGDRPAGTPLRVLVDDRHAPDRAASAERAALAAVGVPVDAAFAEPEDDAAARAAKLAAADVVLHLPAADGVLGAAARGLRGGRRRRSSRPPATSPSCSRTTSRGSSPSTTTRAARPATSSAWPPTPTCWPACARAPAGPARPGRPGTPRPASCAPRSTAWWPRPRPRRCGGRCG